LNLLFFSFHSATVTIVSIRHQHKWKRRRKRKKGKGALIEKTTRTCGKGKVIDQGRKERERWKGRDVQSVVGISQGSTTRQPHKVLDRKTRADRTLSRDESTIDDHMKGIVWSVAVDGSRILDDILDDERQFGKESSLDEFTV